MKAVYYIGNNRSWGHVLTCVCDIQISMSDIEVLRNSKKLEW
jgi:hypothetical protein